MIKFLYPSGLVALATFALPLAVQAQVGAVSSARIYYVSNNLESPVPEKPIRELTAPLTAAELSVGRIDINTAERHQNMTGIGAAFSEIGTLAWATLPADQQQILLHALFDAKEGAGLSFCRLPVGSSDFATSAYSYSEVPDDYEMKNFSLARDEKSIIPAVVAARQVNPSLQLFASPWSPPGWMKLSGKMDGGGGKNHENNRLRDEEPIYAAYALYFEKYLTGYLQHGIPIARLCPQNEMDCNPGYPGCVMEPAQTIKLVTGHLAPRFKASKITTEIWPGTFRETPKAPWATECMKNDAFRAAASGLGIQYYNGHLIEDMAKNYPGVRFMHTEASCDDGKNTAKQALNRFGEMIGNFNAGCDNYAYWNMLLDEQQKSGWGWKQNSLVTIDRVTHEIRYNADFQPVCLASRFVRPGDVRVTAAFHNANGIKFSTPVAAFGNARGETVILAQNQSDAPVVLDLIMNGTPGKLLLPANADCAAVFPAPGGDKNSKTSPADAL